MEKENKEKEKSSAQKEKASRGRVASDNLFLAKKCLYGERVAPDNFFIPKRKNRPYGFAPPDNLFLFLKEKIARVASHPLRIYFYFKIEYIEYIKIFCYLNHTFCLLK